MERRRFLQVLGMAAGCLAVDPERLLWVPGAKTIVVPPIGGWVTTPHFVGHNRVLGIGPTRNSFITVDWVTREALTLLERSLTFTHYVHRQYDEGLWTPGA